MESTLVSDRPTRLLRCEDRTAATAEIAARWHAVRRQRTEILRGEEGADWFENRQRFLAATAELAASRRLSRFFYIVEKAAAPAVGA